MLMSVLCLKGSGKPVRKAYREAQELMTVDTNALLFLGSAAVAVYASRLRLPSAPPVCASRLRLSFAPLVCASGAKTRASAGL